MISFFFKLSKNIPQCQSCKQYGHQRSSHNDCPNNPKKINNNTNRNNNEIFDQPRFITHEEINQNVENEQVY